MSPPIEPVPPERNGSITIPPLILKILRVWFFTVVKCNNIKTIFHNVVILRSIDHKVFDSILLDSLTKCG